MTTAETQDRQRFTPPGDAPAPAGDGAARHPAPAEQSFIPGMKSDTTCQGELGTSTGVNISPGSDDDGWIVPPPVKLADGTRVQLFKDGEALHAAFEAIRHAKRRIGLEVYIWADDATGRAFAELLSQKARDGLQVFAMYDSLGSLASDREVFREMRRNGVHLQEFHPIRPWECRYSWRPANRDHRKLLVIDDEIAGLGGLNVGAEYAGSWVVPLRGGSIGRGKCDLWRDNAVGLVGPSSRLFVRAMRQTWGYVTRGGRIGKAEFYHNLDFSQGDVAVLGSVPSRSSPLVGFIRRLIDGARKSIDLTMAYFAPPEEFIDALCRAARRGVRVRLMVPGKGDVPILVIAARSFYEKLMAAGVEVYERQSVVLHAKTLVVDQEVTVIGSTNLDYRSIEYNLELSTAIKSEQFGHHARALFDHDVRFARQILLKEWRKRTYRDQFVQWVVNRSRYLL